MTPAERNKMWDSIRNHAAAWKRDGYVMRGLSLEEEEFLLSELDRRDEALRKISVMREVFQYIDEPPRKGGCPIMTVQGDFIPAAKIAREALGEG